MTHPANGTPPATCPGCTALEAEIRHLREQLLNLGQEVAGFAGRLGAHEAFVRAAGAVAAGPEPYEQVVAWQARRRAMLAVPAGAEVAR